MCVCGVGGGGGGLRNPCISTPADTLDPDAMIGEMTEMPHQNIYFTVRNIWECFKPAYVPQLMMESLSLTLLYNWTLRSGLYNKLGIVDCIYLRVTCLN